MSFGRALITGGAGLIGSHIADALIDAGVSEVVVLDDFTRGRRENLATASATGRVRVIEWDVRRVEDVARAIEGVDVVFHQAAIRITHCAEDPRLAKDVLVDGTFNVLEAAVRAKVRKVVAASSASVYGLAEIFPTEENHHAYANRTIYGAAKLFNEGLLRSFNDMLPPAIVRHHYCAPGRCCVISRRGFVTTAASRPPAACFQLRTTAVRRLGPFRSKPSPNCRFRCHAMGCFASSATGPTTSFGCGPNAPR